MAQAPVKEHDPDLFDPVKAPRPAKAWFNWWTMDRPTANLITGEWIGPGPRCQEAFIYPSKDAAQTVADDWLKEHEAMGCWCGFGPASYLGAYEEGKSPP